MGTCWHFLVGVQLRAHTIYVTFPTSPRPLTCGQCLPLSFYEFSYHKEEPTRCWVKPVCRTAAGTNAGRGTMSPLVVGWP